ncbi:MAG: hypothetical protein ABI614_27440, partial [Planctomycetota bacterium]
MDTPSTGCSPAAAPTAAATGVPLRPPVNGAAWIPAVSTGEPEGEPLEFGEPATVATVATAFAVKLRDGDALLGELVPPPGSGAPEKPSVTSARRTTTAPARSPPPPAAATLSVGPAAPAADGAPPPA